MYRDRVEEKTEVLSSHRLHNSRRPACQQVLNVETGLDQDEESRDIEAWTLSQGCGAVGPKWRGTPTRTFSGGQGKTGKMPLSLCSDSKLGP